MAYIVIMIVVRIMKSCGNFGANLSEIKSDENVGGHFARGFNNEFIKNRFKCQQV